MSEPESQFTLVFCTGGQAQLEDGEEVIWYSDDDEDFRSTVSDEFLDAVKDQERVLTYLVSEGILDEDEAEECEIESESLDADGNDDSEDVPARSVS